MHAIKKKNIDFLNNFNFRIPNKKNTTQGILENCEPVKNETSKLKLGLFEKAGSIIFKTYFFVQ